MLRLPLSDIASVYQTKASSGNHIELEARFGSFNGKGEFVSNITRETFTRLYGIYSAHVPPTIERTTDSGQNVSVLQGTSACQNQGQSFVRKTVTTPQSDQEMAKTTWLRKNRLWLYDIK